PGLRAEPAETPRPGPALDRRSPAGEAAGPRVGTEPCEGPPFPRGSVGARVSKLPDLRRSCTPSRAPASAVLTHPLTNGLAPVLGAEPRSGAPDHRISRHLTAPGSYSPGAVGARSSDPSG